MIIDRQAKDLTAEAERLAKVQQEEISAARATVENGIALKQGFRNYMMRMYENGTSVDVVRNAEQLHARAAGFEPARRQTIPSHVLFTPVEWQDMIKQKPSQAFSLELFRRENNIGSVMLKREAYAKMFTHSCKTVTDNCVRSFWSNMNIRKGKPMHTLCLYVGTSCFILWAVVNVITACIYLLT